VVWWRKLEKKRFVCDVIENGMAAAVVTGEEKDDLFGRSVALGVYREEGESEV
jgi:hypothetical protein